jgi:hypothetical protein
MAAAWESAPLVGADAAPAWQSAPLVEPPATGEHGYAAAAPDAAKNAFNNEGLAGYGRHSAPAASAAPSVPLPAVPLPAVAPSPGLDREMPTMAGNLPSETPGTPGPSMTLDDVRKVLEPDPNKVYGSPPIEGSTASAIAGGGGRVAASMFSPFARNPQTGETNLTLPPAIRNPLLGALDVLQGRYSVGESGNPLTVQPTPNTLALASGAATPMRVGGEAVPPGLAAREAPLSIEFQKNGLGPAASAKIAATPEGTPVSGEPASQQLATVPEPALPAVPAAPAGTPTTSAAAKQIAAAYYDKANAAGGTLTPQFTNKFIDSVAASNPQTEAGQAVAGQNSISALADRLQSLKDQPMTLQGAQEVDEALGGLITKEFGVKGLTKDGMNLQNVQRSFRDQITNAEPGDVTGGTAGFDALGPARKAYSQAMKLDDMERIQERADLTLNPATSIQTQIRTLLTNRTKARGYSPEEISALHDAAERGVVGGALHVFGNRLIPMVGGAVGFLHGGPVGTMVGAGMSHVAGSFMRNMGSNLQAKRLSNVTDVLGRGIPPNPLGPAH